MNTISVSYAVVWQIDFAPEYKWSKCGKCFNIKIGRQIKQAYKSRCIGYNIKDRFYSLTKLRNYLVKILNIFHAVIFEN